MTVLLVKCWSGHANVTFEQLFRSCIMGWQTTFTLSKRSKGCYLITDEIMGHIQPGLQGVQASRIHVHLPTLLKAERAGRHAFPFHVSVVIGFSAAWSKQCDIRVKVTSSSCRCYLRHASNTRTYVNIDYYSQHTSAALTINENFDGGGSFLFGKSALE